MPKQSKHFSHFTDTSKFALKKLWKGRQEQMRY